MKTVQMTPIGFVSNERTGTSDDFWGGVVSTITLDSGQFKAEALLGLAEFSHLEVIYLFHGVKPEQIETGARHPRENKDWPKVGIFAQRAKARPNRIGLSCCEIIKVKGLDIEVRGLDAIQGTPVLDIKPYVREFGPRGLVTQPNWISELMINYYK